MQKFCLISVLSILLLLVAAQILNARESAELVVNTWSDDCCASCDALPGFNNMVGHWFNEVRDGSHGSRAFDDYSKWRIDGHFTQDLLTDGTYEQYAADSSWIDYVDVAIVALHGTRRNSNHHWGARVRSQNINDECIADPDEMEVGDYNNENLVLVSCYSVNKNYFSHWSEWKQMFGGMQALNGFHGKAWLADWLHDDYENFADDGFDVPLKTAFMDNLYESNAFNDGGTIVDQCPVTVSAGSSSTEARSYRDNYYYYTWGSDPSGNSNWARWGVIGCDPGGEGAY